MTNRGMRNVNTICGTPIAECSQCGTKIYGSQLEWHALLSSTGLHKAIPCENCGHIDPAFEKRTYGNPRRTSAGGSFEEDPECKYWWTKKKPLWSID